MSHEPDWLPSLRIVERGDGAARDAGDGSDGGLDPGQANLEPADLHRRVDAAHHLAHPPRGQRASITRDQAGQVTRTVHVDAVGVALSAERTAVGGRLPARLGRVRLEQREISRAGSQAQQGEQRAGHRQKACGSQLWRVRVTGEDLRADDEHLPEAATRDRRHRLRIEQRQEHAGSRLAGRRDAVRRLELALRARRQQRGVGSVAALPGRVVVDQADVRQRAGHALDECGGRHFAAEKPRPHVLQRRRGAGARLTKAELQKGGQ
mmetsp:Transcript_13903/g.45501  ORF Transcript_13903/g.45501 Transcript_13903/m.45501 type:complete len:265 (+) Transcript_13903:2419-3213(+)